MAKIIIHYFTGTGNTAHSVKLITEQLQKENHEVSVWQVKKGVVPPDKSFDFHIIAFPVLSWSAPSIMKQYLRKLPHVNGTKTAILAINGAIFSKGKLINGYSGQALEQVECILKRKKYDVFLTSNASFPDNWTQMTPPPSTDECNTIISIGEADVQTFITNFLAEKKELYRCGFGNVVWSYIVALLFGTIGRRMLGKFYIADEHCTGCGLCVKTCPVNCIKLSEQKPYWASNCEDCNRCINICPEKAIQVSLPILIVQLISNLAFTIWGIWAVLKYTPTFIQVNSALLIPIEIILIIGVIAFFLWVACVPVDGIIQLLLKNKSIRRFCSKSHTQQFGRYMAPDFKPLKHD